MKKVFFFLVIFLVFSAFPSVNKAVSFTTIEVKNDISSLNMRTGPGTQFERLATLAPSSKATLLHKTISGGDEWLLVSIESGLTGWVAGEYTNQSSGNVFEPDQKIDQKVTIEASSLNVRAGPHTSFTRVGRLPRGASVQAIYQENGWLMVLMEDNLAGWVAGWHTSADIAEPLASQQPTSSNTPANDTLIMRMAPGWDEEEINPAEMEILETEDNWAKVVLPNGQTGWVMGKGLPWSGYDGQVFTLLKVVTESGALRLRSGPGLSHDITGRVNKGTHLLLLNEENGWGFVLSPDNTKGWVSMDYTQKKPLPLGKDRADSDPVFISWPGGTNNPLSRKKIVIDPGHGGRDPGATGKTGTREKDVALDTSLYLANILRELGAQVVLTRETDVYLTLQERVSIASRAGGDIFISVHANAHYNTFASGTETFYYPQNSTSSQSYHLASCVQKELVDLLQLPDKGVKSGNFHVIRETPIPSILVELAFLSNAVDEALLKHEPLLEEATRSMAAGIVRYFQEIQAY